MKSAPPGFSEWGFRTPMPAMGLRSSCVPPWDSRLAESAVAAQQIMAHA